MEYGGVTVSEALNIVSTRWIYVEQTGRHVSYLTCNNYVIISLLRKKKQCRTRMAEAP